MRLLCRLNKALFRAGLRWRPFLRWSLAVEDRAYPVIVLWGVSGSPEETA